MKLKQCPSCKKMFLPNYWQHICDDCRKAHEAERARKVKKEFAPFAPYGGSDKVRIFCPICGAENNFSSARRNRAWCWKCQALVYDPKIDKV